MVKCRLCGKNFRVISNTHLGSEHKMTIAKYSEKFSNVGVGFLLSIFQLSKNDPRYLRWEKSLAGRRTNWSKGFTKETHLGLKKISDTFKNKNINNFSAWMERAKKIGIIPDSTKPLPRNRELAFKIGLVLGDGSCHKASNNLIYLNIGKNDSDYFTSEIKNHITKKRLGIGPYAHEIYTFITADELPKTFVQVRP